ncbi:hypothetical protein BDZ89DRAFT_305139 [Hymenopellis radicata]|nr:hypothetical protein BDZ89DRAFT_305139 [Hymenopellis radicata]
MVEVLLNKKDSAVSAYPDRNADVDLVKPFRPCYDSFDTTCLERGTCDCILCLFFQFNSTRRQALHSKLQHRGWRAGYMYGDGGREGAAERSYQDADQASQGGRPPPLAQEQPSSYRDYTSGATYAEQQRPLLGPFAMSNTMQPPMGPQSPPYSLPHTHHHGYPQHLMQQVPPIYTSSYPQSPSDLPLSNPFYAQGTAPSLSSFSPTSQSDSFNYSGTGSYMPYSHSISPSVYSLHPFQLVLSTRPHRP